MGILQNVPSRGSNPEEKKTVLDTQKMDPVRFGGKTEGAIRGEIGYLRRYEGYFLLRVCPCTSQVSTCSPSASNVLPNGERGRRQRQIKRLANEVQKSLSVLV